MIDEFVRKNLVLEPSRRLNTADLEGLLRLCSPDVSFEDPVGSGPGSGRDALRTHLAEAIAAQVHEIPGEPIAAQDGSRALVPVTAVMDYLPRGPAYAQLGWLQPPDEPDGKRLKCEYVLMIRTGSDGLIQELKAFWGTTDIEVIG